IIDLHPSRKIIPASCFLDNECRLLSSQRRNMIGETRRGIGGTSEEEVSFNCMDHLPVSLDDVLVTAELARRPTRSPHYAAEGRALTRGGTESSGTATSRP